MKYRVVEFEGRFYVQHRSWFCWLTTEETVNGWLEPVRRNSLQEAKEFIWMLAGINDKPNPARVVYQYPEPTNDPS